MQRLVDFVMIRYDARGTRVLLRHSLPGIERLQPELDPGAVQAYPDLNC